MGAHETAQASVTVTVPRESHEERLDVFLAKALTGRTRTAIQQLIHSGDVAVDGIVQRRPSVRVLAGNRVCVTLPQIVEAAAPESKPIALNVVYEDQHLAVIDKPAGLVVHPGTGHGEDTLVNGLLYRWPQILEVGDRERPGIVHRLDMDTSGLMLVAKSPEAYGALVEAVRARRLTRSYTLLAWGQVSPPAGIIDAPLTRHPTRRRMQTIGAEGRDARTAYRVLRRLPKTTLVEATLETGRTHQIRVHFKAIGFPVVGDLTYGRSGFGLHRQFLHASRLAFLHPVTGESVDLTSPLPADLVDALEAAEQARS